jgi:TRAP-type mannitol/chloroaromatic compound transport system substrate-binding protein
VPIRSVADFKGLKIRSPEGMAAEVFRRVGAIPTAIPLPELHAALEKKSVDAADASSYANNESLGFYKLAKYPIFPGIHSMAVLQFVVNEEIWKKIGSHGQAALEAWYLAAWADTTRASDLEDRKLAAMARSGGQNLEIINWAAEERAKFRKIAESVWAEEASKSELAKAAYDAHIAFMKQYGLLP